MPVYFAQPSLGGPLKIGSTRDLTLRVRAMNHASPNGMELLAAIPGGRAREGFLHTALRAWHVRGEWFRSCPDIWRAVVEAHDFGDLPWVPTEPDPELTIQQVVAMAREAFGSARRARAFLGRTGGFVSSGYGARPSSAEAGAALFLRSWAQGDLPAFIAKSFSVGSDEPLRSTGAPA